MLVCWSLAGPGWTVSRFAPGQVLYQRPQPCSCLILSCPRGHPGLAVIQVRWAGLQISLFGLPAILAGTAWVYSAPARDGDARGLICSPSTHHKTVTLGTGKFTGVYYTSQTSLRSSFFFCLFSLLLLRLSLGLGWLGASPWFYWVRAKCRSRPWSTQLGLHLYTISFGIPMFSKHFEDIS